MSTNDPLIGQQFGDYVLQSLLGAGGMARVYMGYDEKLDRYAAVKVSEPQLIAGEYDDEYRERFLREARAIARLKHPNIIGVYQFNQVGSSYYMAMELVEGRNLHQVLREYVRDNRQIPYEQMLIILRDVASALDYAHEQGIIHRDVKPSNIMIKEDGHATLMDFGLALNVPEGTIGNTFGSVHYIAPEQAISSAQATAQSDLYSLGVVLYEMLTGRVPFDDVSAMSVALKHISDPPPPPSAINPKITPQLEAVVTRILDKDPTKRYHTGAEFIRALEEAILEQANQETEPERRASAPAGSTGAGSAGAVAVKEADSSLDRPTTRDTASRPKMFAPPVLEDAAPLEKTRSRAGLIVVGVLVLIVVVGGMIFAMRNFGSAADNDAATQTAAALAAVADEPTASSTELPTDAPTESATATSTEVLTATDVPTEQPTEAQTVAPTTAAPTEAPTEIAQATPTSPAVGVGTAQPAPVALVYDSRALVLLNSSQDQAVDARDLTFAQVTAEGDRLVFRSRDWTAGNLRSVEPAECFYISTSAFTSLPASDPLFSGCDVQGFRQSINTFWISSDLTLGFEVRRAGQVLATCPVTGPRATIEKRCELALTGATMAQLATAEPTLTPPPSDTPTPSATATEALVAEEGDPQVLLIYDGRTLVLYNRDPQEAVNIQGLSFVQRREGQSSVSFQSSEWRTGELFALGAGRCYQVWSLNYRRLPADEPPADICLVREGFNQTSRSFWVNSNPEIVFEVRRSGEVLATCPVAMPDDTEILRCVVDVRS